jgi:ketosteroid isomerase-like protein
VTDASQDVVRAAVDALNRGELEAFAACLDAEVEWEETGEAFPGLAGTYRGPEEVRQWAEQAAVDLWNHLWMEVEELTETKDGRILLGILITARGGSSGIETEQRAWQLFSLRDGRIARRLGPFWTRDKAIEAVRSSE